MFLGLLLTQNENSLLELPSEKDLLECQKSAATVRRVELNRCAGIQ